jgi:uncharacterized membrane protein YdjX (TVP38/TMEM64 family)
LTEPNAGPRWRRYLPLAALAVAIAMAFAFDLHHLLSIETLRLHDEVLRNAVAARPELAAMAYTVGYALVVATALPAAVLMTVAGGYFFGIWLGGSLAVVGATLGALGVFLVARTSLGSRLFSGNGTIREKLRTGFQEDAWSYLFILRLLPLLPFVVVNVGAALLGVRLRVYAVATFLGMLPGSFVYASVGNGLGAIIAKGAEPELDLVLQPAILGPLLALAALALLPVAYKRWKGWSTAE